MQSNILIGCLLGMLTIGFANVSAASKVVEKTTATLTRDGEHLEAKYSAALTGLQMELSNAIPHIDGKLLDAFIKSRAAEASASAAVAAAKRASGSKEPKEMVTSTNAVKEAEEASALAEKQSLEAARPILVDVDRFLANNTFDSRLIRCAILADATPLGLAAFAGQGQQQESLVETLLADDDLMKQMLEAGGAKDGRYGQAMKIYTDIQKASKRAGEHGIFQRLALGTSLEQAVPVIQRNREDQPNAPATVDPVNRYLHYEKAYLAGELDPAFKNMTTWECRHITDCDAPDHVLAWGREMLRNYRPDYIFNPDLKWRYVGIVRSDIGYGSQNVNDIASLEFYQNCLKGGGVCGRRAFFGRFILRSFGIPTWGVAQPGHAAIGRWTSDGWTVTFGAAFKHSTFDGRNGADFLLETQARKVPKDYLKMLRAQWLGDVLGEQKCDSMKAGTGGLWNVLALYQEMAIVAAAKPKEVALVGENLAEANETKAEVIMKESITAADKEIVTNKDGVITIPAVACSKPTSNTSKIFFMKSFSGGMQLHYNRPGNQAEEFEYVFEALKSGNYALTARVGTVSMDKASSVQHLLVTPNDDKTPVEIALPFTLGLWERTKPVEFALIKGRNILRFTCNAPNFGLSIKDFTLTPVN